jgi:hypothetical protein
MSAHTKIIAKGKVKISLARELSDKDFEEPKPTIISGTENKHINIVTPVKTKGRPSKKKSEKATTSPIVEGEEDPATSLHLVEEDDAGNHTRKSPFGLKNAKKVEIIPQVKKVYQFVNQMTGSLGGNGYNGAIYGELTVGSMQKVINLMVEHCELNHTSRFIDVGSGLGKPNFHASQSPGVRLSIGVELETIRWQVRLCSFVLQFLLINAFF